MTEYASTLVINSQPTVLDLHFFLSSLHSSSRLIFLSGPALCSLQFSLQILLTWEENKSVRGWSWYVFPDDGWCYFLNWLIECLTLLGHFFLAMHSTVQYSSQYFTWNKNVVSHVLYSQAHMILDVSHMQHLEAHMVFRCFTWTDVCVTTTTQTTTQLLC